MVLDVGEGREMSEVQQCLEQEGQQQQQQQQQQRKQLQQQRRERERREQEQRQRGAQKDDSDDEVVEVLPLAQRLQRASAQVCTWMCVWMCDRRRVHVWHVKISGILCVLFF